MAVFTRVYNAPNPEAALAALSTSDRAKWYFGVGVKGSPIAWEETYKMHVNSAGSIWQ